MNQQKSLEQVFHQIPLKVKKHTNYFSVYEDILARYRNQECKILEIGVLDGGSLLLWKRYLGPRARIIGVDINPRASELESNEFEIVIGDQSSTEFWRNLRITFGQFDLIIDDGGHTNRQQMITLLNSIELLKDGGKLVIEDVHCSYIKEFGNPSKYSFVNFAFKIVHKLNSRFFENPNDNISQSIYGVTFYESLVIFDINRQRCKLNEEVSNFSTASTRGDHRYRGDRIYTWIERDLKKILNPIASNEKVRRFLKEFKRQILQIYLIVRFKIENFTLRKYFKKLT